jgi:hypothetical protein
MARTAGALPVHAGLGSGEVESTVHAHDDAGHEPGFMRNRTAWATSSGVPTRLAAARWANASNTQARRWGGAASQNSVSMTPGETALTTAA